VLLQSSAQGLTTQEAQRRSPEIGANESASSRPVTGLVQLLRLFIHPLAIILLLASMASASFGDVINASIIVVMVLWG